MAAGSTAYGLEDRWHGLFFWKFHRDSGDDYNV